MKQKKSDELDAVFQALASRARRLIMDLVKQDPGCSVNHVCEHFDISRIGVMKHIRVLQEARLIVSRKSGRTRQLYFNAAPIQMIYDRWSDEYASFWATQAVDLKFRSERAAKKGATKTRNPKTGRQSSSKRKKVTT